MNINSVAKTVSIVRQIPQQIPSIVNRKLDLLSSTFYSLPALQFFRGGWGDLKLLDELENEKRQAISGHGRVLSKLQIQWEKPQVFEKFIIQDGSFPSPLAEILPKESKKASFKFVKPKNTSSSGKKGENSARIPLVALLVHTGDHGYTIRLKNNAIPLAEQGIASLLIENPFYGNRKPENQIRSSLRHVTDLIVLGGALVGEVNGLFNYFEESGEYGPYVVSGFSMGGLISGFCATLSPFNGNKSGIGIVPCVAPHSAKPIFCGGLLHERVDWETLCSQLPSACNSKQNAKEKLEEVLDRTDLRTFPLPQIPEASIIICAEHDQYVPNSGPVIHEHWKGSQLRFLPAAGHVTTSLLHRRVLNLAIQDSIQILNSQMSKQESLD